MKNDKDILKGTEYDFIRANEHLGKYVILLGLSGSYSYGTNIEESDIDIRGITLSQKSDLIGLTQFEQYVDEDTDTVIYAFNKMITLLMDIRFGKYQKEDGTFRDSFYEMLADFEKRLHYASENTDLPEKPDMK